MRDLYHPQATPGGAISQEFSFVSAPVTSAATSVNVSPLL